ncbi:hypothetical protein BD289DRAFT_481362 [Coniella lustricola]|uniref:Uncharacterized protein n=1 Tax=Coniella lustricola TaxID=2025994 RepID=A0A2T3ACF7_9PEZI|nr:hypothetical protein BD289DRAFT_481362 [Coniella lustricola]
MLLPLLKAVKASLSSKKMTDNARPASIQVNGKPISPPILIGSSVGAFFASNEQVQTEQQTQRQQQQRFPKLSRRQRERPLPKLPLIIPIPTPLLQPLEDMDPASSSSSLAPLSPSFPFPIIRVPVPAPPCPSTPAEKSPVSSCSQETQFQVAEYIPQRPPLRCTATYSTFRSLTGITTLTLTRTAPTESNNLAATSAAAITTTTATTALFRTETCKRCINGMEKCLICYRRAQVNLSLFNGGDPACDGCRQGLCGARGTVSTPSIMSSGFVRARIVPRFIGDDGGESFVSTPCFLPFAARVSASALLPTVVPSAESYWYSTEPLTSRSYRDCAGDTTASIASLQVIKNLPRPQYNGTAAAIDEMELRDGSGIDHCIEAANVSHDDDNVDELMFSDTSSPRDCISFDLDSYEIRQVDNIVVASGSPRLIVIDLKADSEKEEMNR